MKTLAAALIFAALIAACADGGRPGVVPRPRAYPRPALTGGGIRIHTVEGIKIALDSAAATTTGADGALTAVYAPEGATLYLSVRRGLRGSALAEQLANRRERMALNLGGATGRTDTFRDSTGYNCLINRALDAGVPTPVQLMAWNDSLGTLVWGAFVWHAAPTNTDSVAPVANALYDKAFVILNNL